MFPPSFTLYGPGKDFKVILGGGRKNFNNSQNFDDGRIDGTDLISEWTRFAENVTDPIVRVGCWR